MATAIRIISKLRRWGIGWRRIFLCVVGLHGRRWKGFCERCGQELDQW